MPGQSGAELLALVGQRFPGMKRLVMTGSLDPCLKTLICEQARPLDILTKPLEAVMLRTRLLSALG